jgi:hypothetical protein
LNANHSQKQQEGEKEKRRRGEEEKGEEEKGEGRRGEGRKEKKGFDQAHRARHVVSPFLLPCFGL